MVKVLFCWELGAGLGHVNPLRLIAESVLRQAASRGYAIEPIFALRDSVFVRSSLKSLPGPAINAPTNLQSRPLRSNGGSYADILATIGYTDIEQLRASVTAWHDLFTVVKPDILVADHSPTAVLAARGRMPILLVGNGFTCPPTNISEFPALRRDIEPVRTHPRLLQNVNSILRETGGNEIKHLPELFDVDARSVFTAKPIDAYRGLRQEAYAGPFEPIKPQTSDREGKPIFLYTRTDAPHVDKLVDTVSKVAQSVVAFVAGPHSSVHELLRIRGAKVLKERPNLPDILPNTSAVVSQGGIGITHAAASAGLPQAVFPVHLEALITSARLKALGAAAIETEADVSKMRIAIARLIGEQQLRQNALNLANEIHSEGFPASPPCHAARQVLRLIKDE